MPSVHRARSVGHLEQLAYERAERDAARTDAGWPYYFDDDEAERAIEFFEKLLVHTKGKWAGEPFTLSDWQKFITGQLFGWKRRIDDTRRFRIAYIQVARKNGKTAWAAGVGLYCLIADHEPRAEVYSAAVKKDQAKLVFNDATAFVKRSKALREYCVPFKTAITMPLLGGTFQPLSSDTKSMDGLGAHCAIVDELHAHPTGMVWDLIETSTTARRQPLVLAITTAGSGMAGVCWEQRAHAINVLEATVTDDAYFAFIAEPDEELEWTSEEYLEQANPNLDISVSRDQLHEKRERAKESPRLQNAFRRLHGDEWTEQVERWVDLAVWDEAVGDVPFKELPEFLGGQVCAVGVDLSTNTDLTSAVAAFAQSDGSIYVIQRSWLPADNIRRRVERDKVPYDKWARDGVITLTPGNIIDHEYILVCLQEWARLYKIQPGIAYDPFGASQFAITAGNSGLTMVEHRQGVISMHEPVKTVERLILGRKLIHGGDPVLRWCLGNMSVSGNATGLLKPDKEKSVERIDAAVAMVMAVGMASAAPKHKAAPRVFAL